jgi:lipopolysaccharide biosynthesis glycosyltransferase
LWLDADLIITGDILPFYHTDFEGNFAVACSYGEPMRETIRNNCRSLGLADDKKYFNAGVMLCNLEAWRSLDLPSMIAKRLREDRKLRFPGQDLVNLLFYGRVKIADYRYYNSMVHCISGEEDLRFARENAVIIHFPGEAKPWRFHDLPFSDVWARYHAHSPFGGKPLRRTSYFKLKAAFERAQRGT